MMAVELFVVGSVFFSLANDHSKFIGVNVGSNMSGRKLIVLGGNGFVGSQVTRFAVQAGYNVIVACRSATPMHPNEPWAQKAQYVSIDALSRPQVFEFLDDHPDASAIISTIGLLTMDPKDGRRMNGDAAINIAAGMYERKSISKFVFVSAADLQPANYFLRGYYQGKRAAERAMLDNIPERAAILRPGFVYGNRMLPQGFSIPLGLVGLPLELVFRPLQSLIPLTLLTPPISVEDVAKAAVYACLNPDSKGIFEYKGMRELSAAYTNSQVKSTQGSPDTEKEKSH